MLHNFWVTPNGKIKSVGIIGHEDFAFELINKLGGAYYNDATTHLESIGWVKVSHWKGRKTPDLCIIPGRKLNEFQEKAINDYELENNIKIRRDA